MEIRKLPHGYDKYQIYDSLVEELKEMGLANQELFAMKAGRDFNTIYTTIMPRPVKSINLEVNFTGDLGYTIDIDGIITAGLK